MSYDVTVGVLTRWDKVLGETFPEEYSDWVDGGPIDTYRNTQEFTREKYTGIQQTRTEATAGAKVPFRNTWLASPPKYPHGRLDSATFDDTMVQTVDNHGAYIVLVVEEIDGAGVPAGWEGMTRNDPIEPVALWPEVRAALIALTDNQEQADAVTVLVDTWWADTGEAGTPKQLDRLLSTYTSGG